MSGNEIQTGQVVRLCGLRLTQVMHNGSLVAAQEFIPQKGSWRVRLPSGDAMEVQAETMKPLDAQDKYAEGQVVRVRGVGVWHPKLEGGLVAVQEYIPLKDQWRVLTPAGERFELHSENLKVLDVNTMFQEGEVVRLSGLQHTLSMMYNNKLVAVQEYVQLKDMWRVILPSGEKVEFHSEYMRRVCPPTRFSEGQLVYVKGSSDPVAVQQYLSETDQWRVRLPTGAAQNVYPENLRSADEPSEEPGKAWENFAGSGAGQDRGQDGGGGFLSKMRQRGASITQRFVGGGGGAAAGGADGGGGGGGMFSKMKGALPFGGARGGYSSGDPKGGFKENDGAHLCGLMMRSDGQLVAIQEWNDKKKKWRVRLIPSGDAIEVSSDNLKPQINPEDFATGQTVKVVGSGKRAWEGKIVAIQQPVEAKGMWKVIQPSGEAADIWGSCLQPVDEHGNPVLPPFPAAPGGVEDGAQDQELLEELAGLLTGTGVTVPQVAKYTDGDLTELLKEELKLGVVKRNRMKEAVRRSGHKFGAPSGRICF
eukprot:Hpha_TRINITY_DN15859_c1_g3::TRINITY_DN15859_c1_g3_i1::g.189095::m.189095